MTDRYVKHISTGVVYVYQPQFSEPDFMPVTDITGETFGYPQPEVAPVEPTIVEAPSDGGSIP